MTVGEDCHVPLVEVCLLGRRLDAFMKDRAVEPRQPVVGRVDCLGVLIEDLLDLAPEGDQVVDVLGST